MQDNLFKKAVSDIKKNMFPLSAMVAYMIIGQITANTVCAMYSITGFPCPGCGLTRSTLALMRGDITGSLHYHPLTVPLMLYFITALIIYLKRGQMPKFWNRVSVVMFTVFITVWIIRLIMYFPHTPPMVWNEFSYFQRIISMFKG